MATEKLQHERLVRGIAKGAGVVFISTIIARILGYVIRAVIARHYGPEVYGYISTSLALFTLASTVALLGFGSTLSRQIAFYLNTSKTDRIKSLVITAYLISSGIAIVAGVLIFVFSPLLSNAFFKNSTLVPFFKYFAVALIFFVWIRLSSNIFRAFKKIVWYTLIADVLRFFLILVAIIVFVLFHFSPKQLGSTYLVAFGIVGIFGTISAYFFTPLKEYPSRDILSETRALFSFSWPLMLSSIIYMLLFRVDIIMVGYFMNQSDVGIYNSAVPVGQLLTIVLSSFTPFLLPQMTESFAKQDHVQLDNIFSISTKWIFLLTIPTFSLIFFFPEFIIRTIFGKQFIEAGGVLQIIAIGFLLAASVGPTGNLLVVLGKTKLHLFNNTITIIMNIVLNYILIPIYGITGAAIATATSYGFLNIISLIEIYKLQGIQPFNLDFTKIGIAAISIAFLMSWLIHSPTFWIGILCFILYAILYFLILRFIHCFDENDMIIFSEIQKKYKKPIFYLKKFLNI